MGGVTARRAPMREVMMPKEASVVHEAGLRLSAALRCLWAMTGKGFAYPQLCEQRISVPEGTEGAGEWGWGGCGSIDREAGSARGRGSRAECSRQLSSERPGRWRVPFARRISRHFLRR